MLGRKTQPTILSKVPPNSVTIMPTTYWQKSWSGRSNNSGWSPTGCYKSYPLVSFLLWSHYHSWWVSGNLAFSPLRDFNVLIFFSYWNHLQINQLLALDLFFSSFAEDILLGASVQSETRPLPGSLSFTASIWIVFCPLPIPSFSPYLGLREFSMGRNSFLLSGHLVGRGQGYWQAS